MNQVPTSLDATLLTVVLAVLAIGLPILIVLAIRFFWDRSLHLGRSKELEKLIWQLHRIASAMEHQLNVSFPAVQPGTEEAADLAFLERPAAQAKRAATPAPARSVAPVTQVPQATMPASVPQASASVPQAAANAAPQAAAPIPVPQVATPTTAAPAPPSEPAQQQPAVAQEQPAEPDGFPPLVPRDPKEPPRHGGVNSMFGF